MQTHTHTDTHTDTYTHTHMLQTHSPTHPTTALTHTRTCTYTHSHTLAATSDWTDCRWRAPCSSRTTSCRLPHSQRSRSNQVRQHTTHAHTHIHTHTYAHSTHPHPHTHTHIRLPTSTHTRTHAYPHPHTRTRTHRSVLNDTEPRAVLRGEDPQDKLNLDRSFRADNHTSAKHHHARQLLHHGLCLSVLCHQHGY